jgi:hypothetical protein
MFLRDVRANSLIVVCRRLTLKLLHSFRRNGLIVRKSNNGTPEEVVCYGVASVFTPEKNRRQGYANHMMRLLHWVIGGGTSGAEFPDAWGMPPTPVHEVTVGVCSVLYSDVGPDFYRRCGKVPQEEGWIVRGANAMVWNVEEQLASHPSAQNMELDIGSNAQNWKWLDEEGCKAIWDADERLMRAEIVEAVSALSKRAQQTDLKCHFTVLPSGGTAASQIARSKFYLDSANKGQTEAIWGVTLDTEDAAEHAFATWALDLPAPTMILTRLRATEETFPTVLSGVLEIASKAGMKRVEAWNLPQHLQATARQLGGTYEEREEHLSAISWYGKEQLGEIVWSFNERFCWC